MIAKSVPAAGCTWKQFCSSSIVFGVNQAEVLAVAKVTQNIKNDVVGPGCKVNATILAQDDQTMHPLFRQALDSRLIFLEGSLGKRMSQYSSFQAMSGFVAGCYCAFIAVCKVLDALVPVSLTNVGVSSRVDRAHC